MLSDIPFRTKIIFHKMLLGKVRLVKYLSIIYFKLSQYELIYKECHNESKVLFIHSEEHISREDFLIFCKSILRKSSKNKEIDFFYLKRKISVKSLVKFLKNQNSLKSQLENALNSFEKKYKVLIVHCDTVLLQNYIVHRMNDEDIRTISLQHGNYADINNDVFRLVYRSSVAKSILCWDDNHKYYFEKFHDKNSKIVSFGSYVMPIRKSHNKQHSKKKIGVFFNGPDRIKENRLLASIYNSIKNRGLDVISISHPRFRISDRLIFFFQNKILIGTNKNKEKYIFSHIFVYNSTVYHEYLNSDTEIILINNEISLNSHTNIFDKKNYLNKSIEKNKILDSFTKLVNHIENEI